jgi:hypothetical protein
LYRYSVTGKQADAAKTSAPFACFTKADRFKDASTERAKHLPAPGWGSLHVGIKLTHDP